MPGDGLCTVLFGEGERSVKANTDRVDKAHMKIRALAVASVAMLSLLTACGAEEGTIDPVETSPSATVTDEPTDSGEPTESEEPTDEPTESDEPTDEPTESEEPTGDAERFQDTYAALNVLFADVAAQESDANPRNAEQANKAAGLDDTTDLIFADFTVGKNESDGSFCLEADNGTYVASVFKGSTGEVALGDGECSYELDAHEVVGDLVADKWSKGEELMGDLAPSGPLRN